MDLSTFTCRGECKYADTRGAMWAEVIYAGRAYFPYVVIHTCVHEPEGD